MLLMILVELRNEIDQKKSQETMLDCASDLS